MNPEINSGNYVWEGEGACETEGACEMECEVRLGTHIVHSPRTISSHSRTIRLPKDSDIGCGTVYQSMSSTFPHLSQIKW